MNTPAYESTKENYQLLPKAQLIALINQRMFGRKSEAHPNPDQGDLFTQPEPKDASVATAEENPNAAPPSDSEAESTQTKNNKKPLKIKPGRKPLPESLPREERVIDLDDKSCKHC